MIVLSYAGRFEKLRVRESTILLHAHTKLLQAINCTLYFQSPVVANSSSVFLGHA